MFSPAVKYALIVVGVMIVVMAFSKWTGRTRQNQDGIAAVAEKIKNQYNASLQPINGVEALVLISKSMASLDTLRTLYSPHVIKNVFGVEGDAFDSNIKQHQAELQRGIQYGFSARY